MSTLSFPASLPERYQCLALVGQGSFGSVYKAWDQQLSRYVAIKFIHQPSRFNRDLLVREARVLAQLEHPAVCHIYEVADVVDSHKHSHLYMVMQYATGPSLATLTSIGGNDVQFTLQWFKVLAEGVNRLHQSGIVHRDITPQNIILQQPEGGAEKDAQPKPVLVDFGIAQSSFSSLGEVGKSGTECYMAPEIVTGELAENAEFTADTDVYSLFAVLYFALSGYSPSASHPIALQSLNPSLPSDLCQWIMHGLTAEKSHRLANAGLFAEELERWLENRPLQQVLRRQSWFDRGFYRFRLAVRRHPITGVSLLSVFISLIAIGAIVVNQPLSLAASSNTRTNQAQALNAERAANTISAVQAVTIANAFASQADVLGHGGNNFAAWDASQRALTFFRKAIAIDPHNIDAYLAYATYVTTEPRWHLPVERETQIMKAIATVELAMEDGMSDWRLYWHGAHLYQVLTHYSQSQKSQKQWLQQALIYAKTAAQLNPDNSDVKDILQAIKQQLEQLTTAEPANE
ncbi:hypothetical protein CWI84_03815 [Idiomarina tyrosinivorans]|uniref:Protein kinase domain-containing protein n=1 Tax=Idiomarina tyrosinivorans TaxID=1445662 RepID=A0A432ZSA9_9GAMM|nr:serine/threonine-protein kinase [Idiomarina tyrosinivorans]RUO80721.1 hypothetical protein CWI84_03815 [Idiomarina tyrosinivorans]